MGDGVNKNINTDNALGPLLEKESFLSLDPNIQSKILDAAHNNKEKDGGEMGKFLGTNPANSSMHIALILCCLLIVVLIIDSIHAYWIGDGINMELVNVVVPVITLALGYIFGKGSNS